MRNLRRVVDFQFVQFFLFLGGWELKVGNQIPIFFFLLSFHHFFLMPFLFISSAFDEYISFIDLLVVALGIILGSLQNI